MCDYCGESAPYMNLSWGGQPFSFCDDSCHHTWFRIRNLCVYKNYIVTCEQLAENESIKCLILAKKAYYQGLIRRLTKTKLKKHADQMIQEYVNLVGEPPSKEFIDFEIEVWGTL